MKRSYLLALVIALAAGAWLLSGIYPDLLAGADDVGPTAIDKVADTKPALPLPTVRVARLMARERPEEVVVYGRTEAVRTVLIKAETPGRIVDLPVRRGARVKAGDMLARLALDDREARLSEAEAMVRQRRIEYEAAEKLKAKGFRAKTAHAANEASLDAAKAQVARIEIDISKTRVRAPFDGVVEEQVAELGAYVKVGEVIARLVDEDPYLVVGQVSEIDVARIALGAEGRARLTNGEQVAGKIRFIAATADPETRTFRIELEVPNPGHRLRDGLTAELSLPVGTIRAHAVTPAILTLDDKGRIGVRSVDADRRVRFHAVQILASDGDGVWLAGLPEVVDLIVVGQEFVRHGDAVKAVAIETGS
ncbi:MAG: efflux RND transporter periplasmic adaptor subunit [Alphaproteobacteria bacterium]|jgi:multidrug efflux system membrane fusion protein|nr:efflux RND transporter periplasmic adaptor subunit [Alphaproteobacteria bacterium]